MKQNSPTISLTNQNKPGLFSNLVLWNNPLSCVSHTHLKPNLIVDQLQ